MWSATASFRGIARHAATNQIALFEGEKAIPRERCLQVPRDTHAEPVNVNMAQKWNADELAELRPILWQYIGASLSREPRARHPACASCGEQIGNHPGRRSRFCRRKRAIASGSRRQRRLRRERRSGPTGAMKNSGRTLPRRSGPSSPACASGAVFTSSPASSERRCPIRDRNPAMVVLSSGVENHAPETIDSPRRQCGQDVAALALLELVFGFDG